MRIFILLLVGLILSGCQSGGDIRADLNMAVLTVETEKEFRNLPMLKEFKNSIDVYEFTVDVPVELVAQRFKHCWSDGQLLNLSQTKVDKEVQISDFKNIKNYYDKLKNRAAFKKSLPKDINDPLKNIKAV